MEEGPKLTRHDEVRTERIASVSGVVVEGMGSVERANLVAVERIVS